VGQKVNPIGLRLGIIRSWDSNWYDEKSFAGKLTEDLTIRNYVRNRPPSVLSSRSTPRARAS
jgi:small subunit ribosomal protein S3